MSDSYETDLNLRVTVELLRDSEGTVVDYRVLLPIPTALQPFNPLIVSHGVHEALMLPVSLDWLEVLEAAKGLPDG